MAETAIAGQVVFDAIQSTHDTDDDLDGSVLVGYVVVAEWSDPKGERWLSTITRDISGERPPTWTVRGWLHDALFGEWPSKDEDDG